MWHITAHRAINVILFTFIIAAIALAQWLDSRDGVGYSAGREADIAAAEARAQARRDRAAAALCVDVSGPGAAWHWSHDGQLICTPRRAGLASTTIKNRAQL